MLPSVPRPVAALLALLFTLTASPLPLPAQAQPADTVRRPAPPRMPEDPRTAPTQKPPLHAQHWLAITGKPLAATAGALTFARGGNAVDAAVAMLAATCTMWDTLSCGGETQALIYDPHARKVIGINALGVAPTGATAEFYRAGGHRFPPEYGPLAAVTPGTPGGMLTMLAEYGKLSLEEVLAPAIELADGYPIEAQLANNIERQKDRLKQWRYSRAVMLPHLGEDREAPRAGERFVQSDLAATWRRLVEAEQQARRQGRDRKQAIYAAYERFYRGDIARELVRGAQEEGALITLEDLADWKVLIEEPVRTSYRGIDVYKLPFWQQGPAMLQALNILENADLQAMGYNSPRYLHTLYQAMSLAFADRDFYYGDPYFPPEEPVQGLLSKEYAKSRFALIDWNRNDPAVKPGDPYPFQGGSNPFRQLLDGWDVSRFLPVDSAARSGQQDRLPPTPADSAAAATRAPRDTAAPPPLDDDAFQRGTTTVVSADAEGWVVSITPSGGWVPAVIAGRTGIGLSQRAQSFVTSPEDGPYNVIEPGKRPRVTLTPTMALRDGAPFLAFAVQGGDSQDQNLLQFFLNVVEFGMNVQQAAEAPNMNSFQMLSSFGAHETRPGHMLVATSLPEATRETLRALGYTLEFGARTSGPINAIFFDGRHRTMWGGSSNHGEDYGIGW
ncbi:MAG TPA: gamma-glutamyltransferase [Longimicrobiales bacterium]|nr:gamma-glutamyltransferase [Longimicrobiales bacterium]